MTVNLIIATAQLGADNDVVTDSPPGPGLTAAESPPDHVTGGLRLLGWAAGRTLWVVILAAWGWSLWPRRSSLQFGPVGKGTYVIDALLLVPAAMLLLGFANRLVRVVKAGRSDDETPAVLRSFGPGVLAAHGGDDQSLEWRVLRVRRRHPGLTGAVHVRGTVAPGHWVVVRLTDGRLVWPRSTVQPVVGTARADLPAAVLAQPGTIGTVQRLLASYAQTTSQADNLPPVIWRRPGPESRWWKLGAPRFLVTVLFYMHLHRRLMALAGALVRAAMTSDAQDGGRSRRSLVQASQECQALAGALPRRAWIPIVAAVGTAALTVLGPFLPLARVGLLGHIITQHAVPIMLYTLIIGVPPLVVFFRAVRCKQALLGATTAMPKRAAVDEAASLPGWDVYWLEREAFAAVNLAEPREWESQGWIRGLVFTAYAIAFGIPVIYADPVTGSVAVMTFIAALFPLARWRRGRAARRQLRAESVPRDPQPDLGAQPAR